MIIVCVFSVIIAIGLGFACRAIMKNKGYDSLAGWFCCGLFLGIIGLVICLVMQDNRQQMPPYGQQQYGQPPYGQPGYYGQSNPYAMNRDDASAGMKVLCFFMVLHGKLWDGYLTDGRDR